MNVEIEKLPKSTLKLKITVPSDKVRETYDKVLDEKVKNTEIAGFRKGQAPRKMVEENIDQRQFNSDVLNLLLQTFYSQALKEHHLTPIANPKVEVQQFEKDKEFIFNALIAIKPEIKIGDFRKKLNEIYLAKKKSLDQENAERLQKGERIEIEHVQITPSEVIGALVESCEMEISDLLIDEEVDRMLARLIDQTEGIGMSVDEYLKAKNTTAQDLRRNYSASAEKSVRAEFALGQLIGAEKIEVSDAEVDQMAQASGDPNVQKQMQNPAQKWYIRSILAKNKLISKLIEEVEAQKTSPQKEQNGK